MNILHPINFFRDFRNDFPIQLKSPSINKIYNTFKSQGLAVSKNSLYEFMEHFADAYCIFTVPLYNFSMKKNVFWLSKADQLIGGERVTTNSFVSPFFPGTVPEDFRLLCFSVS